MPLINRNNSEDARKQIEKFIPDRNIRETLINFLIEKIIYASKLNSDNWDLNLDKNGNFLRFNTGHEYCIQISRENVLILCIRNVLNLGKGKELDIEFQGYSGKNKILSKDLKKPPDCLVKVPNSIGCIIRHEYIKKYLPFVEEANKKFIEFAIKKTTLLPRMQEAHSIGSVEYLSKITRKELPNPCYTITENSLQKSQEKVISKAKKLTDLELKKEISRITWVSQKVNVITSQYIRNLYISEFVKRQAKGICQDCNQPAPFINRQTGEPYLEAHHIIPLADGGKDIIENVVGLCPNCHKKRHYGWKGDTYL